MDVVADAATAGRRRHHPVPVPVRVGSPHHADPPKQLPANLDLSEQSVQLSTETTPVHYAHVIESNYNASCCYNITAVC